MYAQQRLYFLDHLKWFIIWLMVVFHAAMCYMAFAPQWWYVVDSREPVFSATVFICWADIFIMPVMFFISGYFGLQSLVRHEEKEFWRRKLWRIVLPWLFGVLFIAPPVTYLILASRSAPMDFWTFYTTLFWGPLYEQAQYWYLGALLALYVLQTLAVRLFPVLRVRSAAPVRRQGRLFLALFLLTFLSIGVLGSYLSPDLWQPFFYVLVLQPVRIPTYPDVSYFLLPRRACLPAALVRRRWLHADKSSLACWMFPLQRALPLAAFHVARARGFRTGHRLDQRLLSGRVHLDGDARPPRLLPKISRADDAAARPSFRDFLRRLLPAHGGAVPRRLGSEEHRPRRLLQIRARLPRHVAPLRFPRALRTFPSVGVCPEEGCR